MKKRSLSELKRLCFDTISKKEYGLIKGGDQPVPDYSTAKCTCFYGLSDELPDFNI